MTVTAVTKDPEALSMTLTAEFDATPERVWQLWADPRQLERWWGPPNYPATFEEHDLRPGSRTSYFMTTPEGDTPRGYWDILEVDPPRSLVMSDGFADADGNPSTEMPGPGEMRVAIAEIGGGKTRMTMVGMSGLGAPVSSAKPSSTTSRRGGSTSSTFHHPRAWSPSGPVMQ